jgi:putative sterol carrier protein
MIGAGVRDLYLAGRGFPSFVGVAQDHSGQARALALALARGIGSTRMGAVEVTFAQEAELDLFTEQCFGPAFGHVLTSAVNLLLDEGYPPEAVLLELYMSGELSYTLAKIAELGLVEQSALHSRTSQYGSMSRGMRFILPEVRSKMEEGLAEIRSGGFAREWAAEQAAGSPTLEMLKEAARSLPLNQLEQELRQVLGESPGLAAAQLPGTASAPAAPSAPAANQRPTPPPAPAAARGEGFLRAALARLPRRGGEPQAPAATGTLSEGEMEEVLRSFLASASGDAALLAFSRGRSMTSHYLLRDTGTEFYMRFDDGAVEAGLGPPASPAEVRLETTADVLDGMFTGRINAMRAAMTGRLSFGGDARLAMGLQQIQDDLCRLYTAARASATPLASDR